MPAPVILFVYNRPEHTRQTVTALAQNSLAGATDLWIFSDAPRHPQAVAQVEEVRRYIHTLAATGDFASVSICEAAQNKGLAKSIISGVTEVMQARGNAIVLEDDLVTAPDFLIFMNACLDYYHHNPGVGSISGYSPLRTLPADYGESVYLIPRSCSLGWATWLDRWQQVDWEVRDFAEFNKSFSERHRFNQCGSDRYDRLRRQVESDINSWSIRFGYWQFRQGMNTVYPAISRVRNIGNDGSGVHDARGASYNDELPTTLTPFTLSVPAPDNRIIKLVKKAYSGSRLSQLVRFLRNNGCGPAERALKRLYKSSR